MAGREHKSRHLAENGIDDPLTIVCRYAKKLLHLRPPSPGKEQVIWREREAGDSLYIHRMVVNPACKGKRLFGEVLGWATRHAKSKGLRFVRMDTWADNPPLISYYASFGFRFVEYFTLPDSPELPVHNRRLRVALMEFGI
jgi:ribosomal protein S18 acetylase RimI-like enzyme